MQFSDGQKCSKIFFVERHLNLSIVPKAFLQSVQCQHRNLSIYFLPKIPGNFDVTARPVNSWKQTGSDAAADVLG